MPKKASHTMSELLAAVREVGEDDKYKHLSDHFVEISYLIANHVKLIADIKHFRDHMSRERSAAGNFPMVQDVLKGSAGKPPAGDSPAK